MPEDLTAMSDRDLLIEVRATMRERFDALESRLGSVTKILDDHETRIRILDRRIWLMLLAAAAAGGGTAFGVDKVIGG